MYMVLADDTSARMALHPLVRVLIRPAYLLLFRFFGETQLIFRVIAATLGILSLMAASAVFRRMAKAEQTIDEDFLSGITCEQIRSGHIRKTKGEAAQNRLKGFWQIQGRRL